MSLDRIEARKALSQLEEKGFKITPGLQTSEIETIENLLDSKLPPDLKILLAEGVPIDEENNFFPNWHENPELIIAEDRKAIENAFIFDIDKNHFWHNSFGAKPADKENAEQKAISVIRNWPPLIRVYGHRYMPTEPYKVDNPIISIWQVSDSIIYANNLAAYLEREFNISLSIGHTSQHYEIPYWGSAFDL